MNGTYLRHRKSAVPRSEVTYTLEQYLEAASDERSREFFDSGIMNWRFSYIFVAGTRIGPAYPFKGNWHHRFQFLDVSGALPSSVFVDAIKARRGKLGWY
jgi:hypothetical protein